MEQITGAAHLPSVMALAYLGDARHALFIRRMLVGCGISKSGELNERAQHYVTCEAQARAFLAIEPHLTEAEASVFKRAFNSSHLNKPKRASGKDYRTATGFEAIIGMLTWLGDEKRLEELLSMTVGPNLNGGNSDDTEN